MRIRTATPSLRDNQSFEEAEGTDVGPGHTASLLRSHRFARREPQVPQPIHFDRCGSLFEWGRHNELNRRRLLSYESAYNRFCALAGPFTSACHRIETLQLLSGIDPERPDLQHDAFAALIEAAGDRSFRTRLSTLLVPDPSASLVASLLERTGVPGVPGGRNLVPLLAARRRAHSESGALADVVLAGLDECDEDAAEGKVQRLLTMIASLRERVLLGEAISRLLRIGDLRDARAIFSAARQWMAAASCDDDGSVEVLGTSTAWLRTYQHEVQELSVWCTVESEWLGPVRTAVGRPWH